MSGMRLDDQSLEDLEMLAPAQAFSTALADIAASDIQNTMLEDEGGIFNRAGALASPAVEAGGSEQSAAGMPFNRDDQYLEAAWQVLRPSVHDTGTFAALSLHPTAPFHTGWTT
jgi:hypothetical protein